MKKITIYPISKESTIFLKGIAILLIVLHNYFNHINPIPGQNEFGFSPISYLKSFIFVRSNPLEFFHVFFGFFGHYGVQAFIFISAYGLTKSYLLKQPRYGKFLLHRFNKLYPSFVFAVLLFIIVSLIQNGGQFFGIDVAKDLGLQLSLLANFFPGKAIAVNGPWWFYSLIFQFYIVFPIFMWLNKKFGDAGLIVLACFGLIFTFFVFDALDEISLNALQFFTGHLPEFCLGIFLAKREKVKIPIWLIFLSIIIFIGGNITKWLWPLTLLSFTIIFVVFIQYLFTKKRINWLYYIITFFGSISMYLFACHGILRLNFLILANHLNSPIAALIIGLIYLALSAGIAFLMSETEKSVRFWINSGKSKSIHAYRTIILFFLIIGSFSFLLIKDFSLSNRDESVVIYSISNNFDEKNKDSTIDLIDSIYNSGPYCYFMNFAESYSPAIEIDFDTIALTGTDEIEVSAMIYTIDSAASGHLVVEQFDAPTNIRLLWNAHIFSSSVEEFRLNDWFLFRYRYIIPNGYHLSNYKLKYYIWNNSPGSFHVDDLHLEIIRNKKSEHLLCK